MPAAKKDAVRYVVVQASAGGTDGTYTSRSGPAAAARKAATKRFTARRTEVTLTLRETGTDRTFAYAATRVKLAEPRVTALPGGGEIVHRYTTTVKAVK